MHLLDQLQTDALALNRAVDFDAPFRVTPEGVERDPSAPYPPEYFVDNDGLDSISGDMRWVPLRGYTGQHGYTGPIMHVSEFLGGRLARDILEDVGATYVVTTAECFPADDDLDPGLAGWVVFRLEEETS